MSEIQSLRTRADIASAVGVFVGDESSSRRASIIHGIDIAYLKALKSYRWPQLIRWENAAISVSAQGTGFIHLPKYVRALLGVSDTTTPLNLIEYTARPVVDFTQGFQAFFGIATKLTHVGRFGINVILAAGTGVQIKSSAADTRTVWLRGRRLGDQQQVSTTLNGTTPVVVSLGGPTALWDEIYQFSVVKGTATENQNFVTVEDAGSLTDYGIIERNDTNAQYDRYFLDPIPSGAISLRLVYYETPPTFWDDTQEYPIPIADYLIESGCEWYYRARGEMGRAQAHSRQANEYLLASIQEAGGMRTTVAIPYTAGKPKAYGFGQW